ncbi:C4-dicarboxylate ABC transporter substrate-binding protein [Amylibacter kogurei]|uniref:TRAP transporter small permease protein n=1 Tax=Paramylibacter kogurei TaxID=1889778 RepID=A0A2G5KBN4_9RHOB|nr:TRAP transporter small permease [Amylibacter kogurei]PIB26855.1 C4-dicarboxylate ABC transporter substrate-binding protein [Amylibacter kogurei]
MTFANRWTDRLEENLIAFLLGMMTLMTFANVVARYVFNSNIFYALELTVFMFAWLVLLGASYAVKKSAHLGVDAIINMAGSRTRRILAMISALACIAYAFFLLKGAWDYWAPFANLYPTEGRWFPTGFDESTRGRGWYETQDIPVPFFLNWLSAAFNDGDAYEKLPKVVPYLVLPVSMALLLFRFLQAGWAVWTGKIDMLIVSHEAEDDVEEAAKRLKEQEEAM